MELIIGAVILVIICTLLWEGTKAAVELIASARVDQPSGPPSRWASRPARATPLPGSGWLSRLGGALYNGASRASERLEDRADAGRVRAERDRDVRGPGPDTRRPWRRGRDIWLTCPECGHGGAVPPDPKCECGRVLLGRRDTRFGRWSQLTTRACLCGGPKPTKTTSTANPTEGDTPVTTTPAPSPGAPHSGPAPAGGGPRPVLTPLSGPGATSAGGGVAAAEFTLHDLLDMLGRAEKQLTYAAEQIGSLQMGARTVAAIVTARDLAVSARQTVVAEHGRMLDAARDTAAVGRSEGYVAR